MDLMLLYAVSNMNPCSVCKKQRQPKENFKQCMFKDSLTLLLSVDGVKGKFVCEVMKKRC